MVDSGSFKTTSYLFDIDLGGVGNVLLSGKKLSSSPLAGSPRESTRLDKLDICFGGFSPTAMGDLEEKRKVVMQSEERLRAKREANLLAHQMESAKASEARTYADSDGNSWRYVVLDGEAIRIDGIDADSMTSPSLDIPDSIEGLPVRAIQTGAFTDMRGIESILIPDSVAKIGTHAFRGCSDARSIRFPRGMDTYDSGWTRGCVKLEEMTLPGNLEKVTSAIFDLPALSHLKVGPGTAGVMPAAFGNSKLASIEVSVDNELLSSDGHAIYTKGYEVILALATPLEDYHVVDGCQALARKAFSNFELLSQVSLPESIVVIGDYAYAKCGIRDFEAPDNLRVIGERAFFGCRWLANVKLNEGIEYIGSNAFTDTAISSLHVPSSIRELGHPLADGTDLRFAGKDATFTIGSGVFGPSTALDSDELAIDPHGVLYKKADDGIHLVRALGDLPKSYDVAPGTMEIEESAFAKCSSIEDVNLPEGLLRIGNGAFKDAANLKSASLPGTLQAIGEDSFLGTNLEQIRIPASVESIGARALVTEGAFHAMKAPSLRRIDVEPGNPRYYTEQGLLIERLSNGSERVIVCTSEAQDVRIPDSVTGIAQYAFNGIRTLKTLAMHERVQMIDVRGIALDCLLERLHIDLEQPVEGHSHFDFEFPKTTRAAQQMSLAFGSMNALDVKVIFDHYDNSIVNRNGFDSQAEGQLGAYEQAKRIVERLKDPIYMTPTNKGLMESALRSHLLEACIDIARHDDKDVMEGLLDLGYLNEENISEAIDAVGNVQDASVTNFLLEQKQQRFGAKTIDFSL